MEIAFVIKMLVKHSNHLTNVVPLQLKENANVVIRNVLSSMVEIKTEKVPYPFVMKTQLMELVFNVL